MVTDKKCLKVGGFDLCSAIAGMALLALLAGVASYLHPAIQRFFSSSAVAQWVAAAATFLAVLVAVWQSKAAHEREDLRVEREAKAKSHDAIVRALLHARRNRLQLTMQSAALNNLCQRFEAVLLSKNYSQALNPATVARQLIDVRSVIEKLDLELLYQLDSASAENLAEVISTLDFQIKYQDDFRSKIGHATPKYMEEYLQLSLGQLKAAHLYLDGSWRLYQDKILNGTDLTKPQPSTR